METRKTENRLSLHVPMTFIVLHRMTGGPLLECRRVQAPRSQYTEPHERKGAIEKQAKNNVRICKESDGLIDR